MATPKLAGAEPPDLSPPLWRQMVQASRSILGLLAEDQSADQRVSSVAARAAVSDLTAYGLRAWGLTQVRLVRLTKRPPAQELQAVMAVAFSCLQRRYRSDATVVDQAVEAARYLGGLKAASFINAILRRVLADPVRAREDLEVPMAKANAPEWYWQRLYEAGTAVYAAHCAVAAMPPAFVLRYLGDSPERWRWSEALQARRHRLSWSSDKTLLLSPPAAVELLPGFSEGIFRVQDSSAQRAAGLLPLRPGDRVLDACAAPGGKTFLLLEQARIDLWAVDVSARRLARLEKEWERLRHRFVGSQVSAVVADLTQSDWPTSLPSLFDHIVLDAPCSGSGVARRHPETAWIRTKMQLQRLVDLQERLLDRLWRALRPGGQLLYITCSVFPEEGEQQMLKFLARTPDAYRKPAPGQILPYYVDDDALCASGDGFFYARLEKRLT